MAIRIKGGRDKSLFNTASELSVGDGVSSVFFKYKDDIIKQLADNLREHDKDQPGRLIQSIDVKILPQGTKISFQLLMEDYWKWVDEGRKKGSKQPPMDAMMEFIKVRGLKNDTSKLRKKKIKAVKNKTIRKAYKQTSELVKRKQLAFLIARGIKKHGIKPTYFFSDVINDGLYLKMKKDIEQVLKKEIELQFTV